MLATDAATIAMEVPIYVTPKDIAHLKHELGFAVPLVLETTLTGLRITDTAHRRLLVESVNHQRLHNNPRAPRPSDLTALIDSIA